MSALEDQESEAIMQVPVRETLRTPSIRLYRTGMPPRLSIRLLGPVRIEIDKHPLSVDTRKAVALLAYLAVTARPASRDTLAALLWPGSAEAEAKGALRRTLSVLNGALQGAGLAIDRTAVALGDESADVDLRRFRAALARARAHGHDPDEACLPCLAALEQAVALDRGEFMAGFALRDSETFDEWQLAEREAQRRDLAGALERLARGRMASGAWAGAVAAGRRWLELDPLHEPAHRLLMTAHARAGEPGAAVQQYRECVRILDAELGVAPLADTTELYEAIRGGRVGAERRPEGDRTGGEEARREVASAEVRSPWLPLVGREDDLAVLLGAHRSVGPDGRLLIVEGEPGIGKSRLAAAFVDAVIAAGGRALEARAYAGEGAIAFGAVAGLIRMGLEQPEPVARLRSVRPDLLDEAARLIPLPGASPIPPTAPGRATDPFGRSRLLDALADVLAALAAGPVPGAIVVDDLHWADASTVEVVAYVARRLRGRPLSLLVSWRREELRDHVESDVAAAAERAGLIARTVLRRLDRAEVATMASVALGSGATPDLIDALFAESEGLPLYVAQALVAPTAGAGTIPGGVLALLRSRVASVGEIAGQVLATAAVIGRSFDFGTVHLASGRSEDEAIAGLDELVRRGIVREVDPSEGADVRYDFTHGRLRDVAYESLGLARRRLLHRRVAEALAAPAGLALEAGARWPLIAHHEALAGRTTEAAEAHRRAGEHARSVFANSEAREHLEAALALGSPAVAELHQALGSVTTLLGDYAAAIAHLESAAALAGPDWQAAIEHSLALVHARRGGWERADSHLEAAVAAAGATASGDAKLRSAILTDRSAIAHRRGDPTTAERLAREALVTAESAGDQIGIARAADVLGIVARARGDLASAEAHLGRALATADAAGDVGTQVAARNSLALVCADGGDRERAAKLIREALVRCVRQGDRHRQAALENNLADLLQAMGRRDEAMDHLKRAVAIFADVGGRPGELEPEIWKLVEW